MRSEQKTAQLECPACRDDVHTQRDLIARGYKRVYLCEDDRETWDVADRAERAREARKEKGRITS